MKSRKIVLATLAMAFTLLPGLVSKSFAEGNFGSAQIPPPGNGSNSAPMPQGEKMNVDLLKQKYWAKGEESDLQVVQNRRYSKAGKVELGMLMSSVSSDPFLSIKNAGFRIGFNFSEFIALSAIYWKTFPTTSSAYDSFKVINPDTDPGLNRPRNFYGGEFTVFPIYGKLSVLGKAIVYYDFKASVGLGMTGTDNGNYMTPYFGLGQKIYITKNWSVGLEYRFMRYNESITVGNPNPGTRDRTNFNDIISVGIDFLFGLGRT